MGEYYGDRITKPSTSRLPYRACTNLEHKGQISDSQWCNFAVMLAAWAFVGPKLVICRPINKRGLERAGHSWSEAIAIGRCRPSHYREVP